MNWLDLVIVVAGGIGIIYGLFNGLIKQVFSLVSILIAIFFAGLLAVPMQGFLKNIISGYLLSPVCYLLAFMAIIVIFKILGSLLEKIWDLTPFGFLNYLGGGLLGMLIAIFGLSLLLNFINVFDRHSHLISEQTKQESVLYEKVRVIVPFLYPYVKEQLKKEEKEEKEKIPETVVML